MPACSVPALSDGKLCLSRMPEWTETNPLRVVTGYHNIARRFFSEAGFQHVILLSADGALEAAPLMGTADIILDLVSFAGVTIDHTDVRMSRCCWYMCSGCADLLVWSLHSP